MSSPAMSCNLSPFTSYHLQLRRRDSALILVDLLSGGSKAKIKIAELQETPNCLVTRMSGRPAFEQVPHCIEELDLLHQIPVASPRDTVPHALGSGFGKASGNSETFKDACRDRRAALAHSESGN